MLSMASVGSAGGAAKYFAADNYYTLEESAEESLWYGAGAELLGLAPSEDGDEAQADQPAEEGDPGVEGEKQSEIGLEDGEPEAISPDVEGGEGEEESAAETAAPAEAAEPQVEAGEAPPELAEGDTDALPANGPQGEDLAKSGQADAGPQTQFDPDVPSSEVSSAGQSGTIAQIAKAGDDATPFDPDRAGGLPEGVVAPTAIGKASITADRMPLSNPSGKVDAKTFENILNGVLPDGTQVGKPGDRRLGMDLTFSMPKSASLLAYVGGDKNILEAHMGAVKTTMRWVEGNLAETRVRDEKGQYPVKTGNLVYALFQHDTSRALDPQGHVHAVIANMTRLPNGEWRALHNGEIWRNNTVTSSVYHAAFRDALTKLGYQVELQGKHGTFEIAGVPKAIREAFSQRRETILEKATELGTLTPKGMDKITTNTRDAKANVKDHDALRQRWAAKAADLGWKPEDLVHEARQRAGHQPGLIERGLAAVEGAMRDARLFLTDQLREGNDPLIDKGVDRLRLTPDQARAQIAVASAIRILSQREAAFEVHQITKTALDLGIRDVTSAGIATRVTQLIKSEQLVPGVSDRRDNLVTMVTTREALQTETGILREVETGKGKSERLLAPDHALERLSAAAGERTLNGGQMAAAISIVSGEDRIIAVQGDAGSGKSTMLKPVAAVLGGEGKRVLGLGFQTVIANALREETGIEAMTVARLLMQHQAAVEGDRAAIRKTREELGGAYLVLDEGSLVASDQMLSVLKIANAAGVDRLVLVGDRKQLLPIEAGKSFALVQAGGIATATMQENLRQKTPELQAAAALSKAGKTGEALRLLGDTTREGPNRTELAAAWWLGLAKEDRPGASIFTSGREARDDINARVQEGLRAEGTLMGQGLSLAVADRVDRTAEEMRYARSYEPGLTLEVWKDVGSAGLSRGEYRVTRVFGKGKVEVERHGKRIRFKPEQLPANVKDNRLNLSVLKDVKIHEGDKIRWTGNDHKRGLLNSSTSTVLKIERGQVTVETADKAIVVLEVGDKMLRHLDLAYALNMHMAQGMTADKGALVMGSEERFLANQRLAHVGLTRVRDELHLFTDDKDKLIRQIDRTSGNKTSALEVTGQLQVDRELTTAAIARERDKPFDPGPIVGERSLASNRDQGKLLDALYPGLAPPEKQQTEPPVPQLSVPEKTKGMDI